MAEIARRAGVGPATLYCNFASRRELLEALYVDEVDAVCEPQRRSTAARSVSGSRHGCVGSSSTSRASATSRLSCWPSRISGAPFRRRPSSGPRRRSAPADRGPAQPRDPRRPHARADPRPGRRDRQDPARPWLPRSDPAGGTRRPTTGPQRLIRVGPKHRKRMLLLSPPAGVTVARVVLGFQNGVVLEADGAEGAALPSRASRIPGNSVRFQVITRRGSGLDRNELHRLSDRSRAARDGRPSRSGGLQL
jgi:AcrR family transcriptional regulator